jgi:hypothetical protein
VSDDGVPAMLGHISGFSALAREINPKIEVNHCVILAGTTCETFGTCTGSRHT